MIGYLKHFGNGADWVVAIITVLLIAGMFFFLSYLPKKFPKQASQFRNFYFGYKYLSEKEKIAAPTDRGKIVSTNAGMQAAAAMKKKSKLSAPPLRKVSIRGKMIDHWKCHICGDERPDAQISVFKSDISADHNLPPGTMQQNVRYCNDRKECIEGAKTFSFIKKKE